MYYDTTKMFASDEFSTVPFYNTSYIPDVENDAFGMGDVDTADARGRFVGPLTFFGKRLVDPTWDFLNSVN
jgi:hypothetical protein